MQSYNKKVTHSKTVINENIKNEHRRYSSSIILFFSLLLLRTITLPGIKVKKFAESSATLLYPTTINEKVSLMGCSMVSMFVTSLLVVHASPLIFPGLLDYIVSSPNITNMSLKKATFFVSFVVNAVLNLGFMILGPVDIAFEGYKRYSYILFTIIVLQIAFLSTYYIRDISSKYSLFDASVISAIVDGIVNLVVEKKFKLYTILFVMFCLLNILSDITRKSYSVGFPTLDYSFFGEYLPKPSIVADVIHVLNIDSPFFLLYFLAKNIFFFQGESLNNILSEVDMRTKIALVVISIPCLVYAYYNILLAFSGIKVVLHDLKQNNVYFVVNNIVEYKKDIGKKMLNIAFESSVVNILLLLGIIYLNNYVSLFASIDLLQTIMFFHNIEIAIKSVYASRLYVKTLKL